jgi:hypothetical protein
MTMRRTPNLRIRYPWASDAVAAADVQAMGSDIDQALVATSRLSTDFSKFASVVVSRAAAQSLTKATLTAITFDTATLNNGASSPLSNGVWWVVGSPTRLTAPVACTVLASGFGGVVLGSALGTAGYVQVSVRKNGSATFLQGNKYSPTSAITGQQWTSGVSMFQMAAGDYLELMMAWTGTPAGPFNTDTVLPPTLSLSMVSLPSPA